MTFQVSLTGSQTNPIRPSLVILSFVMFACSPFWYFLCIFRLLPLNTLPNVTSLLRDIAMTVLDLKIYQKVDIFIPVVLLTPGLWKMQLIKHFHMVICHLGFQALLEIVAIFLHAMNPVK